MYTCTPQPQGAEMEELSGLAGFYPQSRCNEKFCLKGIGWEMIGQDSQHPTDTHTLDKIKIKTF